MKYAFWPAFLCLLWAAPLLAAEGDGFFFRDGDRIVVIGDSITVGDGYVRYLENFLRARFPQWTLAVRNGGINGCTAQIGFPVMDDDVLIWKPTVAVINYGMNDGRRKDGLEYYKAGIVPYADKLLANKVRIALCSNTPLDIGDEPGKFTNFNKNFDEMANFAAGFAKERGLAFADQFHFLHTLWGENRKRGKPVPVSEQTLSKLSADSVHVRWGGYTTMTYIILRELHAPTEVSHAAIDAVAGQAVTRRCEVRELTCGGGHVSFVRADESSPCWIDDAGAPGLDLVPFQDELNRMMLQVTGLSAGAYELRIDDQLDGAFTAAQLAEGINLSRNRKSAVYAVGRKVADAIAAQASAVRAARDVMALKPPDWLKFPDLAQQKAAEFARRAPAIAAQDAAIAKAAAPAPHRYEIRPAPRAEEKTP